MAQAFIALGSNLKQPILQVQQAIAHLANTPNIQLKKTSRLYRTAPVGYEDTQLADVPDFINAVIAVETTLAPEVLMQTLLDIEQIFGRERPFANAPRVLDLDLLLYEQVTMHTPLLNLPHPRMLERGFVMLPLADVAADFILPNGLTVVECAKQRASQQVFPLDNA